MSHETVSWHKKKMQNASTKKDTNKGGVEVPRQFEDNVWPQLAYRALKLPSRPGLSGIIYSLTHVLYFPLMIPSDMLVQMIRLT